MKHYDDTGEFGNSVVGDSGGYGGLVNMVYLDLVNMVMLAILVDL